jgi:GDP-4-dehydro-6-deoxy-D-mannose reductase
MSEIVELLVSLARCPVEVEQRAERMRPAEIPCMKGDASRLREATGWQPQISLEQTLADTLAAARKQVAAGSPG